MGVINSQGTRSLNVFTRSLVLGNGGEHRQERALVVELSHRYAEHKQRMIAERFGSGFGEPRSQSDSGKDRD